MFARDGLGVSAYTIVAGILGKDPRSRPHESAGAYLFMNRRKNSAASSSRSTMRIRPNNTTDRYETEVSHSIVPQGKISPGSSISKLTRPELLTLAAKCPARRAVCRNTVESCQT